MIHQLKQILVILGIFLLLEWHILLNQLLNTPVGSISDILEHKFGYHILKSADKRVNRGEVKVSHIMIEEKIQYQMRKIVIKKNYNN